MHRNRRKKNAKSEETKPNKQPIKRNSIRNYVQNWFKLPELDIYFSGKLTQDNQNKIKITEK